MNFITSNIGLRFKGKRDNDSNLFGFNGRADNKSVVSWSISSAFAQESLYPFTPLPIFEIVGNKNKLIR
jgi:hypothetical protein